jgi:hypothetical protein
MKFVCSRKSIIFYWRVMANILLIIITHLFEGGV